MCTGERNAIYTTLGKNYNVHIKPFLKVIHIQQAVNFSVMIYTESSERFCDFTIWTLAISTMTKCYWQKGNSFLYVNVQSI